MLSGLGVLLLLIGVFGMVIGYQMVNDSCLIHGFRWERCWRLPETGEIGARANGVAGFYIGAAVAIVGSIILFGPSLPKLFRKKAPD